MSAKLFFVLLLFAQICVQQEPAIIPDEVLYTPIHANEGEPSQRSSLKLTLDPATVRQSVIEEDRSLLDPVVSAEPGLLTGENEESSLEQILASLARLRVHLADEKPPVVGYEFQRKSAKARAADAGRLFSLDSIHPLREEREHGFQLDGLKD